MIMDVKFGVSISMKKNIYILLLITLFFSCSEYATVNEAFLTGHVVKIDSGNIANKPQWPMFLYGDVLYSLNMDFDYSAGKLTKNEWQKAENLLTSGHGHNEFGHMIISRDDAGTLFVLNRPRQGESKLLSLTKIPHADSIAAVKDQTRWEKYDLCQTPSFWHSGNSFAVLSDSSILVTGAPIQELSHVFSIIDYKNQKIIPLEYWPDDGSPSDNITKTRRYIEDCSLLGNGKGKFLYRNNWGKMAFIFTINETKVNILSDLYSVPFTEKPTTERLACCADNDKIYLLLRDSDGRGKKLDKYKGQFIFGNIVEVYDWNGEKQQVIHLDYYGQSLAISEDGKTLYIFSDYSDDTPEPLIYSYDLSSIK